MHDYAKIFNEFLYQHDVNSTILFITMVILVIIFMFLKNVLINKDSKKHHIIDFIAYILLNILIFESVAIAMYTINYSSYVEELTKKSKVTYTVEKISYNDSIIYPKNAKPIKNAKYLNEEREYPTTNKKLIGKYFYKYKTYKNKKAQKLSGRDDTLIKYKYIPKYSYEAEN